MHVLVSDQVSDGTEEEVVILPLASGAKPGDGQWDCSVGGIEAWLSQYEKLEPLELTDSDRADIAQALRGQEQWEQEGFFEHADKQRNQWE